MRATYIPPGLSFRDRELTGTAPKGIGVTYAAGLERELSLLSGVGGEMAGGNSEYITEVRGHDVTVFFNGDVWNTVWMERPIDQHCHQYSVSAHGISGDEFRKVLDGIR